MSVTKEFSNFEIDRNLYERTKKAKMAHILSGTAKMVEVGVITENECPEGQVGKGKPIIVTIPDDDKKDVSKLIED